MAKATCVSVPTLQLDTDFFYIYSTERSTWALVVLGGPDVVVAQRAREAVSSDFPRGSSFFEPNVSHPTRPGVTKGGGSLKWRSS